MSLSPQFLDDVRARTTLSALIGRTIKVTKAGREHKACCPFHNEKTPSFTINDEKGFYHCFGCGAHGDAIRWMTDQRGLPFIDAVKELADAAGIAMPAPDPQAARKAEAARTLHDVMAAAQAYFVEQLQGLGGAEARAYLDRRGISAATRERFGFGLAPDSRGSLKAALKAFGEPLLVEAGLLIRPEDAPKPEGGKQKTRDTYDRFRGRLMIPIRDARGRVIAFGGRVLGQGEPKYLNSPDTPLFDKGRTLFNLDKAAGPARKTGRVIVVEGYMDAIALAQAGIEEVVAPLGTALTEAQIERLWSLADCPLLCFDGDSAGQRAADRAMLRALPMLRPGQSLSIVTLPPGLDPDDLVRSGGRAAIEPLFTAAQPLVERLWRHEVSAADTATPEQRAGLKARLNERVAAIADPLVRGEYAKQLQDRFFEDFGWGWRRRELSGLRRSIAATRESASGTLLGMAERLQRQTLRAVLLGVSRRPRILYTHREQLDALHMPSAQFAEWRNILVNASYERPALEEDALEAILQMEIGQTERRDLNHDLGFTFYHRHAEHIEAETDLVEVIELLVRLQDYSARLAALDARLYAHSLEGGEYERLIGERDRLLESKRRDEQRISELKANPDGLAAA